MPTPQPTPWERAAVLALGALIILALLVLLLWGAPIDPTLAAPLRLLLALAAAMFGAFLPGAALRLGYERRGLAIRAAGAAAFFMTVWFGGPQLAPGLSPIHPDARPPAQELADAHP